MAAGFRMDVSGMVTGLNKLATRSDAAVRMYAEQGALKMRDFAQENRKWTDRTGQARQRLHGYTGAISNGYRITLAHGVDYGLWLELANEKRFAIIPPTIEYVGTFEIMPGFERLLERLSA